MATFAELQRPDRQSPASLPLHVSNVRTFDTPEFAGMTFLEVEAKSALNKVKGMMFPWSINPYRGCSHACAYCLGGETPILMGDGRTKSLAQLRVGDAVYGTIETGKYRRYVVTRVLDHWQTVKPAYRITLADGTTLVTSGDHRFLSERGWKHVTGAEQGSLQRPHLTTDNRLIGTGAFAEGPKHTEEYRRGYRCGMTRVAPGLRGEPEDPSDEWRKGFLAGIFDAEGSYRGGILRIASTDETLISRITGSLAALGFFQVEVERHEGRCSAVRLRGGLRQHLRFWHVVDPANRRNCSMEQRAVEGSADLQVVSIEPLGIEMPLYDITTGTGDFIANGVVSHNCFARPTHAYLNLNPLGDFEKTVVVKTNVAEVLRRELAKPSWKGEHVAMGTNTDPYQRCEGRYQLMPGIIRALTDNLTPFSILTKGTLITRDLELLRQSAEQVPVSAAMTIGMLDGDLWRTSEPGTPSPSARLAAVRSLNDAGIATGVMLAPIMPGLNDDKDQLAELVDRIAQAGATSITPIVLHLRPGVREVFWPWLEEHHPELVDRYQALYRRSEASEDYRNAVTAFVDQQRQAAWRRHGKPKPPPTRAFSRRDRRYRGGGVGNEGADGGEQLQLL